MTDLSRRQWMQRSGTALAAGAASSHLPILAAIGLAPASAQAATPDLAWRSSYARFDDGLNTTLQASLQVQGKLPEALRGTLYRNGPARFVLGKTRQQHWFDGDGMVQAIRFDGGRVTHQGKLIATPKRAEEERAGRFLYAGFGTTPPQALPLRSPDLTNVGNINVLVMPKARDGDREGALYALWEAGSAIKIDPETLDAHGYKTWSADTAGAPFGAHPRIAPDGTVWNFGYMPGSGRVIVYQIAANGQLQQQKLLNLPQADMVHDFAITARHLVFLLQPIRFSAPQMAATDRGILGGFDWDAKAPLLVAVVSKNDWQIRMFELPNGGVYHLGNAYERGGQLVLGYCLQPEILTLTRTFDHVLGASTHRPETVAAASESRWAWVSIDLQAAGGTARIRQQISSIGPAEFPRFDQRRTGEASRWTVLLQRSKTMAASVFGFDTVTTLEGEADPKVRSWHYGDGWIAEEHQWIAHPDKPGEADGWVIGTAYHWPSETTSVQVFDARAVEQGPIARCQLPYGLPLGLHGQFAVG